MKQIIIDLSKIKNETRRAVATSIQLFLFSLGFKWGGLNEPTEPQHLDSEAFTVGSMREGAKQDRIRFYDEFSDEQIETNLKLGIPTFDAANPFEFMLFMAFAEHIATEMKAVIIEGVKVYINPDGAVLDYTDLLKRVTTEAKKLYNEQFPKKNGAGCEGDES